MIYIEKRESSKTKLSKRILPFLFIGFVFFAPVPGDQEEIQSSVVLACETCENECSSAGLKTCVDDTYFKTCGDYNQDGCFEWKKQACPSDKICKDGSCVLKCTTKATKKCADGDVYWFDSCGTKENKYQECGTTEFTGATRCSNGWMQKEKLVRGCSGSACTVEREWVNDTKCPSGTVCSNNQCVKQCTTHATKKCVDGDVYWFDSCGNKENKYQECGETAFSGTTRCSNGWMQKDRIVRGCSNAACTVEREWVNDTKCPSGTVCSNNQCVKECTTHAYKKCADGDVYWYNSCGVKENKYQECGTTEWGTNYKCSGNWIQKDKIVRGCVNDACTVEREWINQKDCSTLGKSCSNGQCESKPCPTVDIKANNSDGPITIDYNTSANLTWTSTNAQNCVASVSWSGNKAVSGSQSTGNLTQNKTYTITCYKKDGVCGDQCQPVQDSVTVKVKENRDPNANAGPDKTICENKSVKLLGSGSDPDGDALTYSWSCNGGSLSNSAIAQPTFYAPSVSSNTNYTCSLTVTDSHGKKASDSMNILVENCEQPPAPCTPPYVNLKINGADSINLLSGSAATLSWTSVVAGNCVASGDWSGSKPASGSESLGDLISSKTFIITCSNACGTVSDTATVNITGTPSLTVNKTARNVSLGGSYADIAYANPGQVVAFSIKVTAGNVPLQNVIVKDALPDNRFTYRNNTLTVDGVPTAGDILTGISIGDLGANQTKTVIFETDVAASSTFAFGTTQLTDTALAFNTQVSGSDTAKVFVTRTGVGGATDVPTGLTNNILIDSFLLPLIITAIIILLFKTRIIKFEEFMENRKKEYGDFRTNKELQFKIAKIKTKEYFLRKF